MSQATGTCKLVHLLLVILNTELVVQMFFIICDTRMIDLPFVFYRLYWLDLTIIKSSLPNGLDMKSHIDTGGAYKAFVYKVAIS